MFATHGRVLTTPPAAGSILPGITRASLLQLAGALGYVVREDNISVEAALAVSRGGGGGGVGGVGGGRGGKASRGAEEGAGDERW